MQPTPDEHVYQEAGAFHPKGTMFGTVQPLSSSEEVTLRQVALGIAKTSQLTPKDLSTLKGLALIEIDGTRVRLTSLGRHHYNQLPRCVAITDLNCEADYAGLLAKHIGDPSRR